MQLLTLAAVLVACAVRGVAQDDSVLLIQHAASSARIQVDAAAAAAGAAQSVQQDSMKPKKHAGAAAAASHKSKKHAPKTQELSFKVGEHAQVRIDIGEFKDRRVPCTIMSRRTNGRYHIRIPTTPLSKDLFNIPGTLLEKIDSSVNLARDDLNTFRENKKEMERLATQVEKEASLRTHGEANDVGRRRGFTGAQVQKLLDNLHHEMEAELMAEAVALGCPSNFMRKVGGGDRRDRVGKGLPPRVFGEEKAEKVDTLELCGQSCSDTTGCASFEWSPVRKICLMFKAALPFDTKASKDTVFCSVKGAEQTVTKKKR